jgi:hypothetical protein
LRVFLPVEASPQQAQRLIAELLVVRALEIIGEAVMASWVKVWPSSVLNQCGNVESQPTYRLMVKRQQQTFSELSAGFTPLLLL